MTPLRERVHAEHAADIDDADTSDFHHAVDRLRTSSYKLSADIRDIHSVISNQAVTLADQLE